MKILKKGVDHQLISRYSYRVSKRDIETEIETLRFAISYNVAMMKAVPNGADKKTEATIVADRARLAQLRTMLEAV